jgi:hypothetical protein
MKHKMLFQGLLGLRHPHPNLLPSAFAKACSFAESFGGTGRRDRKGEGKFLLSLRERIR